MSHLLELRIDRVASPLGALSVVSDEHDRLRALDFEDHTARLERLLALHYGRGRYTVRAARAPATLSAPLAAFFAGEIAAIDAIAVETGGTDFQRRVWAALRRIPAGATTSYGRLANTIGCGNASRAVGLANGANPVVLVVPCHRVIGADGTLTGYGGGLERKRWLLAHERRWTAATTVPWEESA
jgi:methylated-DNA-[protein]-cysteine S-methyltransferase